MLKVLMKLTEEQFQNLLKINGKIFNKNYIKIKKYIKAKYFFKFHTEKPGIFCPVLRPFHSTNFSGTLSFQSCFYKWQAENRFIHKILPT